MVAIAIPVFSAQMTKAKEQVDAANLRSATSMAVVDYLTNSRTGDQDYVALDDGSNTMIIKNGAKDTTEKYYFSQAKSSEHIVIVITDGGKVKTSRWS